MIDDCSYLAMLSSGLTSPSSVSKPLWRPERLHSHDPSDYNNLDDLFGPVPMPVKTAYDDDDDDDDDDVDDNSSSSSSSIFSIELLLPSVGKVRLTHSNDEIPSTEKMRISHDLSSGHRSG
jgi:hypothetical protein